MTKLCIPSNWFQRDEFKPANVAITDAPVLEGTAHILPLVRSGTGCILNNITGATGVEYAVVVVPHVAVGILVPTSRLVGWVETNGTVFLVAVGAPTSFAPEYYAILRRKVVSTCTCIEYTTQIKDKSYVI